MCQIINNSSFSLLSFTTFDIPKMLHLTSKHYFIALSFNNSDYQTKLCWAFPVLHLLWACPCVSRGAGSHQVSISAPCLRSVASSRGRRSKTGVTVMLSQASVIFSPGPFVVWFSVNPGQLSHTPCGFVGLCCTLGTSEGFLCLRSFDHLYSQFFSSSVSFEGREQHILSTMWVNQ